MVAGGFLTLDMAGHGGVFIAEKGAALLRGEARFDYRPEAPRAASSAKGRAASASATPASAADGALLAALKALRLRLAKERQVPAFVIFSDRSLIDMAERAPRNLTNSPKCMAWAR